MLNLLLISYIDFNHLRYLSAIEVNNREISRQSTLSNIACL